MIPLRSLSCVAMVAVGLAGCSVFGGDDDDEKELEPLDLVDIEESLPVRELWSTKLGKGTEFLRLALLPAGDGTQVIAASYDGVVAALESDSGRRRWSTDLETELTAGPGLGEDRVVVISREGDVICLQSDDGSELWRSSIDGESVAVPQIRAGMVLVITNDGIMRGLSAFDGSLRWTVEQALPNLTLRGASVPVVVGNSVVAGFDNGRLIAVSIDDGTVEWESVLSPPSGRSDLERLADIDGQIANVGQDVYAAGYQGRLAALAAESGQILWARELSTYAGLGADWDQLYTVVGDGEVLALARRNGDEQWRNASLLRRQLTTPIPFDTAVVVGDFEGYLHFLDAGDGRPVARERVGKGMVSGVPVVIAGRLYVQNESGHLAAFEVEAPEPVEADDAEPGED